MESGKLVLGVLGGLAAGALLGVLFAPAKGSKTRKRIFKKGKGYANKLKGKIEEIYQEGVAKYDGLLSDAKEKIS
ncbi:YtxH domain-containing protein [Flavobacterium pedocola]